ncbi:MAG: hypothetical protein J5790_08625 [Bacteroidaceae bacterium]|nr:hypothetical protein [Bacteroidaceae bacterium]
MKKGFLLLMVVAVATFVLGSTTACKEVAKSLVSVSSDSDSVARELPRTLDNAPQPEGNITTWLPAGFLEDGGYKMFILDGDESRFIQDNLGETDTIYVLRLVSFNRVGFEEGDEEEANEHNENATEEGSYIQSYNGPLVVDAYDPATKNFVGRFEGTYFCECEYTPDGDVMHCGESYAGTFTKTDGTKEEFSYFGD